MYKRQDQALSDLNRAIALNPHFYFSYINRGAVYHSKGDYDHSILDYTKAIELNPNDPSAYNNRAISYYGKKEYDKAWDDVHKTEALGGAVNPNFIKALNNESGQ